MAAEPSVSETREKDFQPLLDAFQQESDPRKARGIRHPLRAILGLCLLGFMCGRQSLSGLARFGRDHRRLLKELGFPQPRSPSVATLSRVLGAIDSQALQRALAGWLRGLVEGARGNKGRVAAVDGKTARSSGVHVLNVFLHDVEQVVWAAPVDKKANEITAFKAALKDLLEHYPFLRLVTADAMFAGQPLCELLIENGRHYLFQIKADQPDLLEKMELIFAPQLHKPASPKEFEGEKKKRLRRGA